MTDKPRHVYVKSSRPGRPPYLMAQLPNGEWGHTDARCEAFTLGGRKCKHMEEAKTMAEQERVPDDRAVAVQHNEPLGMVQRVDLAEIVRDHLPTPPLRDDGKHGWIYDFRQAGKRIVGLSTDGVADGVRALAFQGETIRTMWVHLDHEDEDYGYFMASASRFAISPSGQEICLDSTVRAKRVDKWFRDGDRRKGPNPAWYEQGVTKASRNCEEAMMPEALKAEIIRRALELQGDPNAAGVARQALQEPRSNTARAQQAAQPSTTAAPQSNGRQMNQQPPEPPPGARWEDLQIAQLRLDVNAWAKPVFVGYVEDVLGPGKATPAILKLELADEGQPPISDIDEYALGDIVNWLRKKHGKEPLPNATPATDEPTDAEYTEAEAPEQAPINW